jgi:hypothetical protein
VYAGSVGKSKQTILCLIETDRSIKSRVANAAMAVDGKVVMGFRAAACSGAGDLVYWV